MPIHQLYSGRDYDAFLALTGTEKIPGGYIHDNLPDVTNTEAIIERLMFNVWERVQASGIFSPADRQFPDGVKEFVRTRGDGSSVRHIFQEDDTGFATYVENIVVPKSDQPASWRFIRLWRVFHQSDDPHEISSSTVLIGYDHQTRTTFGQQNTVSSTEEIYHEKNTSRPFFSLGGEQMFTSSREYDDTQGTISYACLTRPDSSHSWKHDYLSSDHAFMIKKDGQSRQLKLVEQQRTGRNLVTFHGSHQKGHADEILRVENDFRGNVVETVLTRPGKDPETITEKFSWVYA